MSAEEFAGELAEAVAVVVETAEGWPDTAAPADRSGPTAKVNATLSPKAGVALDLACDLTGDDKTVTVNKALTRNLHLETAMACGGAVYIRETPDGEMERVVFW